MSEAVLITQVPLNLSVWTCANPPKELPNVCIRKSSPTWQFTGRKTRYRGEEYGEIEILRKGSNSGTGKYVRLNDMDGRISRVKLREVVYGV